MENNVGKTDKIIRSIIALVFLYLSFKYNYWWLIVAGLLLITIVTGFCGPYKLLGMNTCKLKK